MGLSDILTNFQKWHQERKTLIHENVSLKIQYDQMMKELTGRIKNAETTEEKEKLLALKQRIIDEGKRVENELKNNK
jgi:regulator of replication initiation timing